MERCASHLRQDVRFKPDRPEGRAVFHIERNQRGFFAKRCHFNMVQILIIGILLILHIQRAVSFQIRFAVQVLHFILQCPTGCVSVQGNREFRCLGFSAFNICGGYDIRIGNDRPPHMDRKCFYNPACTECDFRFSFFFPCVNEVIPGHTAFGGFQRHKFRVAAFSRNSENIRIHRFASDDQICLSARLDPEFLCIRHAVC